MSTWILIYWITAGSPSTYGGWNIATGSVEFLDEAACHSAYQEMRKTKAEEDMGAWGICVPKASRTK